MRRLRNFPLFDFMFAGAGKTPMRICLCAIGLWLCFNSAAGAACTPQMMADLRSRGASPQLIAKMCGGSDAVTQPNLATACATRVGVCSFSGPIGAPCTCTGPTGVYNGTAQ